MAIIPRRSANAHPPEPRDVNDWAGQLPPDATIHVKEGSAYIDTFPAHEAQDDATVEEILLARYGVGTYELAGRHNGLFLPGREKVHIGSQAERQTARHAQATRDAQVSGGGLAEMAEVVGILKDLGWTPGGQPNQGSNELTTMLVQHAVQSLRPADPGKTMEQAFGFIKSAQDLQQNMAPPPPPRPNPKRNRKKAAEAEGKIALGEVLGTALFMGTGLAMQNPNVTQKVFDGVAAKARGVVSRFQRKDRPPAEGDTVAPHEEPHSPDNAMTLEEGIESAKTMLATPIGQRMVDYVRGSIHALAPEDIARHGIEGARKWLGADHPLLLRLHENPARVFDEMSEIVGLTGEPWWKARCHFVSMMANEEDGTTASPHTAEEGPAAADAPVAPQDDGGAHEDASGPFGDDLDGKEG